ncbi:MAG: hypothetical protein AAFY08_08525 [Planctomycetota bacterium]
MAVVCETRQFRGALGRRIEGVRGVLAALVAVALIGPGAAQEVAEPAEQTGATAEVELLHRALVGLAEVEPESIGGAMWTFEPLPGRRLVALPLRLGPGEGDEPVELAAPPIEVGASRFLGWLVPTVEEAGQTLASLGQGDAEAGGGDPLLRDGNDFDLGGARVGDSRRGADDLTAGAVDAAADAVTGPGGELFDPEMLIPRVSRRVTVFPDGRIGWRLERAVAGATLAEGDEPYLLKVRADRLTALQPPRPERLIREAGEDSRDFRLREMALQQEYREQVNAFQMLRQLVLALPDRFEQPMPAMVWAVYDAPRFTPTFAIDGPPPLPWSVPLNGWTSLQALGAMRDAATSDGVSVEALLLVSDLQPLADAGDPTGGLLLAEAMSLAGVIQGAQVDGPVYDAAAALLANGDGATARRVLADLVTVIPPTSASVALLREAAGRLTPGQRLATLRVELTAAADDPAELANAMQSVSSLLLDEQGPPVADLLRVVSEAADGTPAAAMVGRLPIGRLSGQRWSDAVAFLAVASSSSESASVMMRDAVLRVTPAEKLAEALAVIADQPDTSEASPGAAIPVASTGHPILAWIAAPAGEVRRAAWQALPRFVVRVELDTTDAEGAAAEDAPTVLAAVVDAIDPAGEGEAVAAAAFFADQPFADAEGLAALMALTARVPDAAPLVEPVIGAPVPLGRAMASASGEARGAFAESVLAASGRPFEGIGKLLAVPDRGAELGRWVGDRVADGRVPEASEIAGQIGEDGLIDLAGSGEPAVREAAAAGLVALAGGQPIDIATVQGRLDGATDRTKASLQAAWLPSKQELFARRLFDAKGAYRLVATLPGDSEPTVLGVLDLMVDGRQMAFVGNPVALSIPDDRLAIRIANVNELKNLGVRELNDLPLETVAEPLDLLSREGGSWGGSVPVAGEGELELVLEPL